MATYYVRKSGSDSATGLSAALAWLTIDKAANTVAAGDTVYIGAGVYPELVTMDTSGSSGSVIKYIGDVNGFYTGDAGLVIISAYPDATTQAVRAACLDPDGRTFVEWYNVLFNGGTTAAVYSGNSTADNYEGCLYSVCGFVGGHDVGDAAVDIDMNAATTPTGDGLTFTSCAFSNKIVLRYDGNGTAAQNLKVRFNSCVHWPGIGNYAFTWDIVTASTYSSGGVIHNNALFYGGSGITVDHGADTTNTVAVYNSIFYGCTTALNKATSNDGALVEDYNRFYQCNTDRTNVTAGANSRTDSDLGPPLLGGLHDHILYSQWGWSPYKPWEMIRTNDDAYIPEALGAGSSTYAHATDLYGNPRPMGQREASYFWFDASDDAVADPDGVWTNDASTFNSDINSTGASTATAGDNATNEISGGGTNAPASGPTISAVRARFYGATNSALATGNVEIYTDGRGELIGSLTWANVATYAFTDWTTLTVPTGGWTWEVIAALEAVLWKTGGSGTIYARTIQLEVQTSPADDIGAVEARARPEREATTYRSGTYAMRFDGAGFHDIELPVAAALTTVTVYGRYDSSYTGTLPQMQVLNIPGVADQTDVMVGAADTWEQLSIAITPTAAGVARIRLISNDTSASGKCYFDDLEVT